MNQWIKFLQDTKDHKAGEQVSYPAAEAKTLVAAGIAENIEAPKEITEPLAALKTAFEGMKSDLTNLVTDTIETARKNIPKEKPNHNGAESTPDITVIPATVKRYGSLRNFRGKVAGRDAEQRAYEFGMWMLGMYGNESALKFVKEKGMAYTPDEPVRQKVSRENNNFSSGYLVPDQFENDLIDLREQFGVFRKYAKIVPMASDTRSDPRRTGGLTVYVVGESTAPTSSDKTWDRVRLTAKKIGVLTKYTRELNEDAVINIGDDLAGEIGYAFGAFEDDCGFNGTGTSAYANIIGVRSAIGNVTSNAGIFTSTQTGAGSAFTYVIGDFSDTISKLPQYAYHSGDVAWYCSQAFWGSKMHKLAVAAGGNTVMNIVGGVPEPSFLGFPVRISQKMPTSPATSQIDCLFGNLRLAARLGDRRSTSIRMSDVALNAFEQDEIAIVGFERFDIVVNDPGTATTAGPLVALKSASS